MVSISACHAEDPGSIPGGGEAFWSFLLCLHLKSQGALHAKSTDAKHRDAKNRDAKNRMPKNRGAKNRDAKNRDVRNSDAKKY